MQNVIMMSAMTVNQHYTMY